MTDEREHEVLTADDVAAIEPDPFPAVTAAGKEGALYDLLWRRADAATMKIGIHRRVQLSLAEVGELQADPRWSNLDTSPGRLGGHERAVEAHGVYLGTIGDVCFFVAPEV